MDADLAKSGSTFVTSCNFPDNDSSGVLFPSINLDVESVKTSKVSTDLLISI